MTVTVNVQTIGCLEAERAVLGGLLQLNAVEAHALVMHVDAEDFVDARHVAVLEVIVELAGEGVAPDPVTVLGELRRSGRERCFTDDRDAGVYLSDLLAAIPSVGNLGRYARTVIEHAARRRAQTAGARIEQVAGLADLDTARQVTLDELQAVYDGFDRVAS